MSATKDFLAGLGFGAGLGYLLDPSSGSRRMAVLRDKAVHLAHKSADGAGAAARDASHRVRGTMAEAAARFSEADSDDARLEARVRSVMGRFVSHAHAIAVAADRGRVTLSGPILAHEAEPLLAAVARVRGVTDVDDRLERHKPAGNIPSLQGGATPPGRRPDVLQRNWAPATRVAIGAVGVALVAYGVSRRGAARLALTLAGAALAARAAANLEFRQLTGIGAGRRAVDFQKTLHINAPVGEVFDFWSNVENFPSFMAHVRDVRPTVLEHQSHWCIGLPGGMTLEFDAVVTDLVPNRLLAWKSVEGSAVGHAGLVQFEPARDGGTRLQIRMSYNPPAGAVGHAVATLLGADPRTLMDADLVRMKTLIETGRAPRDAAAPLRPDFSAPRA